MYFSFKRTSGQLKFKGLPARDDTSNSERTSYHDCHHDFEKKIIEHLPNFLPA